MFCRSVSRVLRTRNALWKTNRLKADGEHTVLLISRTSPLGDTLCRSLHNGNLPVDSSDFSGSLELEERLYKVFENSSGKIPVAKFIAAVKETGLRVKDPRLRETMKNFEQVLHDEQTEGYIDLTTFKECIHQNIVLIDRALRGGLVVPEFKEFATHIQNIYNKSKGRTEGKVADYIPQLAKFDPSLWGVAACTVDGQRISIGDVHEQFCLQSVSKALIYPIAMDLCSEEKLHSFVGLEPSGKPFYHMEMDSEGKPYNPMINAGALVVCSLVKPKDNLANRCEFSLNKIKQCAGGEYVSVSNSTFISERETADRNYSLGYHMKASSAFPPDTDLNDTFDLYFHLCSIETNCDAGSVMAATLANGGVCPLTGEKILSSKAVQNTLSLMHSCGMYDHSGEFAFQVGIPAKSGVSGAIMVVVPKVCGFMLWSPPLDSLGNSVRGLHFCKELVDIFNFHNYHIVRHSNKKLDPRLKKGEVQGKRLMSLIFAAANGDITALRRYKLSGVHMSLQDYDGRSALHLAAAQGKHEVAKFLLENCNVPADQKDRWGFTPLDEATRFKQSKCEELIRHHLCQQGKLE